MDLSGIIFVVLALGWAGYLIPMVLKHQDDLDKRRPVREFSASLRVLGRGVVRPAVEAPSAPSQSAPSAEPGMTRSAPVTLLTREAARSAARRRRRVLALLLTTLAVVTVTSYLAYTPWFATAIPGALSVAFLVTARVTVRAQQARRVVPVQQRSAPVAQSSGAAASSAPVETQADLATEDTQGVARDDLDAALAVEPVLDEGGLWDPLPVTLPTYVNKARARRTVRTIEITGEGSSAITSSGHDAADSALAAEARESEQAQLPIAETEQKAAGA
ncbi:MAG: hypothetical protein JWQ74_1022 [Marmoricola sp.]|nr:hypothetical protein [Marmoricola sp.]